MPNKPKGFFVALRDWPDLRALLEWWRTRQQDKGDDWPSGGRGAQVEMGTTVDSILPGADGAVQLADDDWAPLSGRVLEAVRNDSLRTIPAGARVFPLKKRGRWRILQALMCSD